MCGFLGALCLCRMFFIPHGIEGAALSAPLFPQARSKLFQNVHHSPVKKGSSPGNTRERPARGLRGTCEGPEKWRRETSIYRTEMKREERGRERCYGWAGVRSRRGTSPPTMARRSTSWRWRRRRWVSGWIRLPSCGPTTLHTGVTPRECYSGQPSGRFSFLASWRGGHSGIGTCWSSGFREACRAMYCQGRHLAMARTTRQPWQGTSLWNRSRRTSTAKVPSRQSVGQSAKLWALGVPEHTSGTGFWFPTTKSGQSMSRATRQSATCRLGALPVCSKGETILSLPLQRKGRTHTSLLFESPRQSLLVPPWPSKRLCGQRRPVQGLERHQGCRNETTSKAIASETQAQAAGERGAGFRSGVRLVFTHRSHTLFARQSSRLSHVWRAQLAVGTSFRFWGSGVGPCHYLLRQKWSGVLGTSGRALPQL